MSGILPATGASIRIVAIAALIAAGMAAAEGGARSLSGLAQMLSPSAWQGAYRQDLALDRSPEAAELHLATFGWTGKAMVEPAICPPDEAASPAMGTVRTDQPL
jgi:hypothetical protein